MVRKSDADVIAAGKMMLKGIKAHAEKFEEQGIDTRWIAEFETLIQTVAQLDNEQKELTGPVGGETGGLGGGDG